MGNQIGLAQLGRPPGHRLHRRRQAKPRGEPHGQLDDPKGLVVHAPEPLLERHPGERAHPVRQGLLEVLLIEEPGVCQPRGKHTLVALAHQIQVDVVPVGHDHENRLQRPLIVHHGDVALVGGHHGQQDLPGQGKKPGVEAARKPDRILDQVRDLFQQLFLFDGTAGVAVRGSPHLLHHHVPSALGIRNHPGRQKSRLVLVGTFQVHRPRVGQPVSEAVTSRRQPVQPDRHHLIPKQRHDPADGAGKAQISLLPAHGAGELHPLHHLGQQPGQNGRRRPRGLALYGEDVLALSEAVDHQGLHAHPLRAGKPDGGLRGLPLRIERDGLRGSPNPGLPGRLQLGDAGHGRRQATGGCVTASRHEGQPRLLEGCGEALDQLVHGRPDDACRQLLHAQLEQERSHAGSCTSDRFNRGKPMASLWATYASATALASWRTRPM